MKYENEELVFMEEDYNKALDPPLAEGGSKLWDETIIDAGVPS